MAAVMGAGTRDQVRWEVLQSRIEADRTARGAYSCALILGTATIFNRSPRTIRRWLEADPRRRPCFELTEEHMAYVPLTGGNLAEAWRLLHKRGLVAVSHKTFIRAFRRLDRAIQRGLVHGLREMRTAQPWVTLPAPERRNEIWELDLALLDDIVIRDPHTNKRGHPWITVVIDVRTRMIVGFSITLSIPKEGHRRGAPISESVFAALADAMLGHDYDGTFVGGKPEWARIDQGSDFMGPVADTLDRLGVAMVPVAAETPQHKPYVERLIGTIKHTYLPPLPGWGVTLREIA